MTHAQGNCKRVACFAMLCVLTAALAAGSASAQVARALLYERGPIPGAPPGHIVQSLNNSAVNHVGGYAVAVNTSDGATTLSHVWGSAAGAAGSVIRTEGTFGPLVQTSYESFYGMSDAGQIAYSASGTGGPVGNFDSVWLDDTPLAVQGNPVPSLPGQFYVFASRPGVTGDGRPFWSSGYSNVAGGSSQNRVLLLDVTAKIVVQGGTLLPGLPSPLVTSSLSFDYRFSELGNHFMIPVQMTTGSTLHDDAMVMDGNGLLAGGLLVREQSPVSPAAGGLPGENWDNFDFCGVTEGGDWFFTGDTEPSTTNDEIIVKNGMIVYREGDFVDGEQLSGDIEHAYMNADGDIAYIWDVQSNTLEALFVNNRLLLKETDPVDLDGDGTADVDSRLSNFTGISSLTVSDRDGSDMVKLYFCADVDTAGTTSTSDDVEGFFCLEASVEDPVAVALQTFQGVTGSGGEVTVTWTTAAGADHVGFHVYRSDRAEGPFARLTTALITGPSPYTFVDRQPTGSATAYYRLGAVDHNGQELLLGLVAVGTGSQLAVTELMPSSPNPFHGATQVRFALARREAVRLSIFDARGRLVRELASGPHDAGPHALRWDGRDLHGRAVASGSYVCKLQTPSATRTLKLARVAGD